MIKPAGHADGSSLSSRWASMSPAPQQRGHDEGRRVTHVGDVEKLASSCKLATQAVELTCRFDAMLRRRKEPKRKSIAIPLMRDLQGSATNKLALFEKLKGRGAFTVDDRRELLKVENMLLTFAATEKG
jgi:hypothetical protein